MSLKRKNIAYHKQIDYASEKKNFSVECTDHVSFLFSDLKGKSGKIRERGSRNLKIYLDAVVKEKSLETYTLFLDNFCDRLKDESNNSDFFIVYAVLLSIDILSSRIGCGETYDEINRNSYIFFFSCLRFILQQRSYFLCIGNIDNSETDISDFHNFIIVSKASKILAKISSEAMRLRMNWNDYIDYDIKRVFQWIKGEQESNDVDDVSPNYIFQQTKNNLESNQHNSYIIIRHSQQFTALLIIKEFIKEIPMIIQNYLDDFFLNIWIALKHNICPIIQEAGLQAFQAAYQLLSTRDTLPNRLLHFYRLWTYIKNNIDKDLLFPLFEESCSCLGSLLALSELLNQKNTFYPFFLVRFTYIIDSLLKMNIPKRDLHLKKCFFKLLPNIVLLNPELFVKSGYLKSCIDIFLASFKEFNTFFLTLEQLLDDHKQTDSHKNDSVLNMNSYFSSHNHWITYNLYIRFLVQSLGDVALAVKNHLSPFIDDLLPYILYALEKSIIVKKYNQGNTSIDDNSIKLAKDNISINVVRMITLHTDFHQIDLDILNCINKIVKGTGEALMVHIPNLINQLFECRLNSFVFLTLLEIAKTLPTTRPFIQSRICPFLQRILNIYKNSLGLNSHTEEIIRLGFSFIGSLGITNHSELHFILDTLFIFAFKGESCHLRKEAVLASCSLLLPLINTHIVSGDDGNTLDLNKLCNPNYDDQSIFDYVSKILQYILLEIDMSSRITVLNALTSKFDIYLLNNTNLAKLLQLVRDYNSHVKKAILLILCRLAALAPELILPILGNLLLEYIDMVKLDLPYHLKLESAVLINDLIQHTKKSIQSSNTLLLDIYIQEIKRVYEKVPRLAQFEYYLIKSNRPLICVPEDTTYWSLKDTDYVLNCLEKSSIFTCSHQASSWNTQDDILQDCCIQYNEILVAYIITLLKGIELLFYLVPFTYLNNLRNDICDYLIHYLFSDTSHTLWISTALNTLSTFVSCVCYPVQPFKDYPVLLPFLLQLLRSPTHSQNVTHAVLRCIGVIGAIDPDNFSNMSTSLVYPEHINLLFPLQENAIYLNPPKGLNFKELLNEFGSFLYNGKLPRPLHIQIKDLNKINCRQKLLRLDSLTTGFSNHLSKYLSRYYNKSNFIGSPEPIIKSRQHSLQQYSIHSSSYYSELFSKDIRVDIFNYTVIVSLIKFLSTIKTNIHYDVTNILLRVIYSLGQSMKMFLSSLLPLFLTIVQNNEDFISNAQLIFFIARVTAIAPRSVQFSIIHLYNILDTQLDKLIHYSQYIVSLKKKKKSTFRRMAFIPVSSSSRDTVFNIPNEHHIHKKHKKSQDISSQSSSSSSSSSMKYYLGDTHFKNVYTSETAINIINQEIRIIIQTLKLSCKSFKFRSLYGDHFISIILKLMKLLSFKNKFQKKITVTILEGLSRLIKYLNVYVNVILPLILNYLCNGLYSISIKIELIQFLQVMISKCDVSSFLSQIFRFLLHLFTHESSDKELRNVILYTMDMLYILNPIELTPFLSIIKNSCTLDDQIYLANMIKNSSLLNFNPFVSILMSDYTDNYKSYLNNINIISQKRRYNFSLGVWKLQYASNLMYPISRVRYQTMTRLKNKKIIKFAKLLDNVNVVTRRHSKSCIDVLNVKPSIISSYDKLSNHSIALRRQMHLNESLWIDEANLKQIWSLSNCSSPEEWNHWLKRLSIEMIRESSVYSIRLCGKVLENGEFGTLAEDIFPIAFLSCWIFLSERGKINISETLTKAFTSRYISPSDLHQLLNIAELMSLYNQFFPIDTNILIRASKRCHAYAKALRYQELNLIENPDRNCIEPLLSIYHCLEDKDAALGILSYAKRHFNLEVDKTWNEKLQRWNIALRSYEIQQLRDPTSVQWFKERLRCIYALGRWDQVSLSASVAWKWNYDNIQNSPDRIEIATIAAFAELNLKNYSKLSYYTSFMKSKYKDCSFQDIEKDQNIITDDDDLYKLQYSTEQEDSFEICFFDIILNIHAGNYDLAKNSIAKARYILGIELSALLGESYTRAYHSLIKAQQLVELEETIQIKHLDPKDTDTLQRIKDLWIKRLLYGNQVDTGVWHSILQVRSLITPLHEDVTTWLKFATLSRKEKCFGISQNVIQSLSSQIKDPRIIVAYAKNVFARGDNKNAYNLLYHFILNFSLYLGITPSTNQSFQYLLDVTSHFEIPYLQKIVDYKKKILSYDSLDDYLTNILEGYFRFSMNRKAFQLTGFQPKFEALKHLHTSGFNITDLDLFASSCYLKLFKWGKNLYRIQPHQLEKILSTDLFSETAFEDKCSIFHNCTHVLDTHQTFNNRNDISNHNRITFDSNISTYQALHNIIEILRTAIRSCPEYYKVWLKWAQINFHLSQLIDRHTHGKGFQDMSNSYKPKKKIQNISLERCLILYHLDKNTKLLESNKCIKCSCRDQTQDKTKSSICQCIHQLPVDENNLTKSKELQYRLDLLDVNLKLQNDMTIHFQFVKQATMGYIRALLLGYNKINIQDILRFLRLWFQHAELPELMDIIKKEIKYLPLCIWLPVVPQILVRLKSNQTKLQNSVRRLLWMVFKVYPEPFIFPLLATLSDTAISRNELKSTSEFVLALGKRYPILVLESQLIQRELIQLSVLLIEKWHKALEETSKLLEKKNNIPRLVNTLLTLHEELDEKKKNNQ